MNGKILILIPIPINEEKPAVGKLPMRQQQQHLHHHHHVNTLHLCVNFIHLLLLLLLHACMLDGVIVYHTHTKEKHQNKAKNLLKFNSMLCKAFGGGSGGGKRVRRISFS